MAQRSGYPLEIDAEQHVYKHASDADLKLWVFRAADHTDNVEASSKELPAAIVFFFGGGWQNGTPGQFLPQAKYLQSRGITAILADYRVGSRHQVKAAACVEDAKSAVRWIRSHAEQLGIDPSRICSAGGSAGGHIACGTALLPGLEAEGEDLSISSVPNALALFNPVLMLAPLEGVDGDGVKLANLTTRLGVEPEAISPIHHVRADLPPTIIFHGTGDTTVPFASAAEFSKRMEANGNRCELKSFQHAPHGFFNLRETPIPESATAGLRNASANVNQDLHRQWHLRTLLELDQFLVSLNWIQGEPNIAVVDNDNVRLRGSLANSFHRFAVEKTGHVAFLGGSITEMDGYRPRVVEWLKKRFPETQFTFTNAGIASTCSHTGAFRLQQDILSHGPVDLLLVEFAVNDDQDARHSADDCVRGMEGIVRHVRGDHPMSDIVMVHFVNPEMLATAQSGKNQLSVEQHESVARHYNISSINLPSELADRIASGSMTWETFGGTHPGPAGNQMAADLVSEVLTAGWNVAAKSTQPSENHPEILKPLLASSFAQGAFLPPTAVTVGEGWQHGIPDWASIPGSKRERFLGESIFYSTQPESQLSFTFSGQAVGAYLLAGPDAGQLEVQIDDGEWKMVELFHSYSKGLHYPRTVMFSSDLPPGEHHVTVRLGKSDNKTSQGTAARILAFTVSE